MFKLYYEGDESEPIGQAEYLHVAKGYAAAAAVREKATVLIVGGATGETVATMTPEHGEQFKAEVARLMRRMGG